MLLRQPLLSSLRHLTAQVRGAQLLSAKPEVISWPHRCRVLESRSSPVALVRGVLLFELLHSALRGTLWGGLREREKSVVLIASPRLTLNAGKSGFSKVVDIFNVTSGTWSTAALSEGRVNFAATSLSSAGVAIFAGGYSTYLDPFI